MLCGGHGCHCHETTKDGKRHSHRKRREDDPSQAALFPRLRKPPGIDDERNPSQSDNDDEDLDGLEGGSQRERGHGSRRLDERKQTGQQREQPQSDPDSERNPTKTPAAAG
jgi:hypothetical protein